MHILKNLLKVKAQQNFTLRACLEIKVIIKITVLKKLQKI